ncbi:MAG TPA: hypothetical protein VEH82_01370 [Acidimicrobiales bacterium]|nr:hypothetical protein [Acidimicrobiales bacterium]
MFEDPARHVRHVLEAHAAQLDPSLLLQALHDGVTQRLLVPEVPVDGALVHAGPLGHGAHGQRVPVAHRRAAEQL